MEGEKEKASTDAEIIQGFPLVSERSSWLEWTRLSLKVDLVPSSRASVELRITWDANVSISRVFLTFSDGVWTHVTFDKVDFGGVCAVSTVIRMDVKYAAILTDVRVSNWASTNILRQRYHPVCQRYRVDQFIKQHQLLLMNVLNNTDMASLVVQMLFDSY